MEKIKRYPAGAKGRDIVDSVVESRQEVNQPVYDQVVNNPGYYGQTNIGCELLQLTTVKNKKDLSGHMLIEDIVRTAENLKLRDPETASVRILGEEVVIKKTSPEIVAFIKACVAGSYTASEDFSLAVSKFVTLLIPMADKPCLPISVGESTVAERAIVDELNEYLANLCERSSVPHTTEFKASAKSVRGLMSAAEG